MSYWILAVLVASGIVVFEGDSRMVDCPFIHRCFGVGARARGMEKSSRCLAMCSGRAAFVFVCTRSDTSVFYG